MKSYLQIIYQKIQNKHHCVVLPFSKATAPLLKVHHNKMMFLTTFALAEKENLLSKTNCSCSYAKFTH